MSGLPNRTEHSDEQLFSELCYVEFHVVPVIMHTKRLGRPVENKLQPLLVVLQDEDQARLLLSSAKQLRDSQDDYTASSIFISPHQTRAERQAAYEARCQRRNQASTRLSRRQGSTDLPSAASANVSRPEAAAARVVVPPTGSGDIHSSALTHDFVTIPSSTGVVSSAVQPSTSKELDHGTLEQILRLLTARLTPTKNTTKSYNPDAAEFTPAATAGPAAAGPAGSCP